METLNIHFRNIAADVSKAITSESNYRAGLVGRVYAAQVHDLFNYGMNACNDQQLVKNCIEKLFLDIASRPEILTDGKPFDASIFKMFRRYLIVMMALAGGTAVSEAHKHLFPTKLKITNGLTNLQREVFFLK